VRKIAFWNVAGLRNKDRDFWEGLKEWDVMFLMETWMDEKGWKKVKGELPKGFNWKVQWAKKRNKKGRAKGGMLMGVRKELEWKEDENWQEKEGVMVRKIKIGDGGE